MNVMLAHFCAVIGCVISVGTFVITLAIYKAVRRIVYHLGANDAS